MASNARVFPFSSLAGDGFGQPEPIPTVTALHAARPAQVAGEPFDFERVYQEQIHYVWRALRRLGAPQADLEDAAHDVFTVVYRRQSDFDCSRPIRPWLFGIAYRVASDYRKRRSRRAEVYSDKSDIGSQASAQDAMGAKQLCALALQGLPIEQRAVLIMHDLEGHSSPEISKALELPLNTVYSRLRLARGRFARLAQEALGEKL